MKESTPLQKRSKQVRLAAINEALRTKLTSALGVTRAMGRARGVDGLAEMVLECTGDLPQEMLAEAEGTAEHYKQNLTQKEIARTIARWGVDDIAKDAIDSRALALSLVRRDRLYSQDV